MSKNKNCVLSFEEARNVMSVYKELIFRLSYEELNKIIGSVNIDDMHELYFKLLEWYYDVTDTEGLYRKLYEDNEGV